MATPQVRNVILEAFQDEPNLAAGLVRVLGNAPLNQLLKC
jgi:hypothetical protein